MLVWVEHQEANRKPTDADEVERLLRNQIAELQAELRDERAGRTRERERLMGLLDKQAELGRLLALLEQRLVSEQRRPWWRRWRG